MDIVTYALLKKQLGTVVDNIADKYNPNTQYATGDIIIYNNELKRALENTTGEFDPAKWEDVKIVDLVSGSNFIMIEALSHTTIGGYEVPQLTDEQLLSAYNGVVAGRNVFIVDDLDTITIQVLDASSIDGISIRILFTDALILTYKENGVIEYVNVKKADINTFVFKGYMSSTEPTENLKTGQLWYESSATDMPEDFPIDVYFYDGEDWSTNTIEYTPTSLELWANINNGHGYYWFGNEWNIIDIDISVDGVTIDKNVLGQLEIKDQGVTNDKINNTLKATSVSDSATDNKFITELALSEYIQSGNLGSPKRLGGENLNNINKTGFYYCDVCTNRPINSNGVMIVSRMVSTAAYVVQIYLAFTLDEMYIRFKDNTTWKSWVKYYNKNEIDVLLADIEQGIEDINDLIPENASANNKFATEQEILFNSVGSGLVVENDIIKVDNALYYDKTGVDNAVSRMMDLLVSRGEQLVINGSGFVGDNTNFPKLQFDGAQANGSFGSFTRTQKNYETNCLTDYFFPVDPSQQYMFEFDAKSIDSTCKLYSYIEMFDIDGKAIGALDHMHYTDTTTTLVQDLEDGDTVVYLTDLTNWHNYTQSYRKGFIFWNYVNSKGYMYPVGTYSKNHVIDIYTDFSSVDKINNTITLKEPWAGGTITAGTSLSQTNSGGNHKYRGINNDSVPTEWTHYKGSYSGIDYSGTNAAGTFSPGTAICKVGFNWNTEASETDQVWVTNISVRSVSPEVPIASNNLI